MGLTPTGDEAEMVPESQRRMSSALSDQQVSFKHELARILSTSTFQTMSQTVDADDDDKAEKRKSSAPSDQVRLKSEAARINIFRSDISIFQTMHPADEEDEEEMLRRAIAISQEEQ